MFLWMNSQLVLLRKYVPLKNEEEPEVDAKLNDMEGQRIDK